MKRIFYFAFFMLVALCGQSQTINQKGVTYRYNGKNKRTPIGGVYIKAVTSNNGVVSDESNGTFTLALNSLQMGSRIGNVRVTKQGMMVFNQQAVDEWNVRKDPLCLILCDADKFQRQKKNLIAIGERQAQKKYEKKLAELKKQNDAKQLQIDDYYNKLDSLENEYQNALKHMDEYADVFARIDESEVDTIAQRAIELFNNGKFEESLYLFEQGNFMKKLEDALHTKKQAQSLKQTADTAEYLADKDIEECRNNIMAQISAYKLNNEWVKAGEMLKGLADNLNDYLSISAYATYCYQQFNFDEGHSYFIKYLNLKKDIKESDKFNYECLYYALAVLDGTRYPSHFEAVLCRLGYMHSDGELQYSFLIRLAHIYIDKNRFDLLDETINWIKQALKTREEAGAQNLNGMKAQLLIVEGELFLKKRNGEEAKQKFLEASKLIGNDADFVGNNQICWITAQVQIANIFIRENKLEAARLTLDCTLDRCSRLIKSKHSSISQKSSFASLYYMYGELYCNMKNYEQSECMFLRSKEFIEEVAKRDTNWTLPMKEMIKVENHLSYIYRNNMRIVECENVCLSALNRCNQLCMIDSSSVSYSYLASTQIELANLYKTKKRYEESEVMWKSALDIYKRLAKSDPDSFEPDLAYTLNGLALLYKSIQCYAESEAMFKSALEIYERLAKSDPDSFEPDLAMLQDNLGSLYGTIQRYAEGEALFKSALEIRERLANSNPDTFEPDLAYTLNGLALLHLSTQRYAESEAKYKSALEIYERLMQSNPQAYEPYLADSYYNLAELYSATQRFTDSETMYKQALEIYERLMQSNPQAYESDLADSYYNLAELYRYTQRFSDSEAMHKQALEIRERLVQSNPQAYEPDLAQSYNNLAILYYDTQHFTDSEAMHKQALEIRDRLAQSNPQAYEPDLARSYNNLANLYSDIQRFSDSEAMYKQALEIRERLAQSNPQAYEPDLAQSYNDLAELFRSTQRFSDSEAMHKQALAIRERLAKSTPQEYEPDLAQSYNNLAILYYDTQRFADSEAMYKQALAIYERLAQSNPQAYEPDLADSYNNLAILYYDTQHLTDSEAMYKQALAIYERFAQSNPQIFETQLMESYYWLGRTMLLEEKYHEAQEPFKKSLHLARKQIKSGTETSLYWENLYYLSFISAKEKDYTSAYTYNEELLPLMNAMYQKDTEDWQADYSGQLVSQSFCANLLGKYKEGEQYSLESIKVDSTKLMAYTNLAAALLFQGKVEEAENLYRQYKAEFKEGFLDDFAEFERLNVIPEERMKDVERIKAMLKE